MRGRNLSSLAVIIIFIAVSAYLSFSGNQTLAETFSGSCKLAGEKWSYDANQNLPPFDCCAGLEACPDGYCCEAGNEALPVTTQIVANPIEHSDEPPTFAAENDPVITKIPETPSETQSEQSEEPENNEPITTVAEKTDTTKLPATVYKKEYYVIDEEIEEEEPIQIFDPKSVEITCYQNSNCGSGGWVGNSYCKNGDVWQSWRTYTCHSPGTEFSYCSYSDKGMKKQDCSEGCSGGECSSTITILSYACYNDSDCGTDGWLGQEYCTGGGGENEDLADTYRNYTCHNPGTPSAYCTHTDTDMIKQDCGDTEYGPWGDPYCYDDDGGGEDVFRLREAWWRGCDQYGCYDGHGADIEKVEECGSKACVDGECVNTPPSIDSYSPTYNPTITVGQSQAFSITKSDPDGDPLTVKWYVDDVLKSQGSDSYTYTATAAGTFEVKVVVSDGTDSVSHKWTLTVNQPNNPPSIDSYSPTYNPTITVGQSQAFSITKSDPDGDPLTVRWFVDDVQKKQGSDSYTYTATAAGTFEVKVTVTDGTDTVSHTWTLTVNQAGNNPPSIDSYSPTNLNPKIDLSQTQTFSITKSDPDGDSLTVKWYVDGSQKTQGADSYSYIGTIPGNFEIKVTVSDGEYTVSHTWTLTVNKPLNRPPSIDSYSPTSNPTINMGQSQTFSITKSDPDGDSLTVKWYVDGSQKNKDSDSFTYTPTSAGTYKIEVTVSDGWETVSHEWTLTVEQTGNLPDLKVSNLIVIWPPNPKAGEITSFEFKIKNVGNKKAENVKFRFLTGESNKNSQQGITLDPGEEIYAAYDYTYNNPGTYTVTAIVDPDDQISESNENNNQMSITVVVT